MSIASPRFIQTKTPLAGLLLLTRLPIADARGEFERMFCVEELAESGFQSGPKQVNRSLTRRRGAVRGMHFQYPPHAEAKLVSCLSGDVFDVAVDVRQGSPTYLQSFSCRLSAVNHNSLLIPAGFAHGFQAMSENCELLYCHSATFTPEAEEGLHPLDPALAINWPLPVAEVSPRDASHSFIPKDFGGVAV